MTRLNICWKCCSVFAMVMLVGCGQRAEIQTAQVEESKHAEPIAEEWVETTELSLDESNETDFAPAPVSETEFQSLSLELQPPQTAAAPNEFRPQQPPVVGSAPTAPSGFSAGQADSAVKKKMVRRQSRPAAKGMSVMSAAEVETEHPPSQTKISVFYATDRKSKNSVGSGDWVNVHFSALLALAVYLVTFAAVFVSDRKMLYGFAAFGSLVAFLVLGQSAMVQWQKQKRLASQKDAIYLSEIRSTGSDELLDYGTCEVTIPPDHKIGHVDSPSLFKLEFTESPEKHVVLHRVIREPSTERFFEDLNSAMDASEDRQALVFVHGYNVSFDDAVKRTAQIVHDLSFDGAPICYSWSSHGAIANYTRDMANADATVIALQSFLQETVRRTGNSTIHLVAHSMGNRALLQALDRIAVGTTRSDNKMFGQLVMAAPDVSAVDFRNRFAPSAIRLADSVTLYASSRDRALLASTEIHGHNRAGMAGESLVMMDGIDTIDVSQVDTSLIGHSYYGDHPELIRDLRALVELAQPASNRSWLMRVPGPDDLEFFQFSDPIRSADDRPSNRRR